MCYTFIVLRLSSLNLYKNVGSDAADTDRGCMLLTRTRTLVHTNAIQRTIEDHKLLTKTWIHASKHIAINRDGKVGRGKSHWVIDLRFNFEPETDKAGVQSVSRLRRHAHCIVGIIRDFPDLKINTRQ